MIDDNYIESGAYNPLKLPLESGDRPLAYRITGLSACDGVLFHVHAEDKTCGGSKCELMYVVIMNIGGKDIYRRQTPCFEEVEKIMLKMFVDFEAAKIAKEYKKKVKIEFLPDTITQDMGQWKLREDKADD